MEIFVWRFLFCMEASRHSRSIDLNFKNMLYNQEETDTRLIIHVSYGCRKGFKNLAIAGSDVVVVIDLYHFYDLNVNKLWIEYDVGQYKRCLPINEYAKCLREEKLTILPFCYVMICFDTVPAFIFQGKKKRWYVWSLFGEATRRFVE